MVVIGVFGFFLVFCVVGLVLFVVVVFEFREGGIGLVIFFCWVG